MLPFSNLIEVLLIFLFTSRAIDDLKSTPFLNSCNPSFDLFVVSVASVAVLEKLDDLLNDPELILSGVAVLFELL